jgi:transcriptional regulator with AAA-type ATPase domain
VIEAAVVLFDDNTLRPEHLVLLDKSQEQNLASHNKQLKKGSLGEEKSPDNTVHAGTAEFIIPQEAFSLDELNYQVLQRTVQLFNGNLTRAANHLGISPRTLSYRLKVRENESKER